MTPEYHFAVVAALLAFLLRYFIQRTRRHSLAHLPGPCSSSWLVGNLPEILRPEHVGDADFSWTKTYGNAVRIKGVFGSDLLFTADPKCLQYILNTSGYNFVKMSQARAQSTLISGRGLTWAQGDQHARQRKIMNPAFSHSSLKALQPVFRRTGQRTVSKWKELISRGGSTSSVIDVSEWLARAALDAVGEAAFGYTFNAIDEGENNVLAKVYRNLFTSVFHGRSDARIALENVWGWVPEFFHPWIGMLPLPAMKILRNYMNVALGVARTLVDRKIQSHEAGLEAGNDVMSILVRANLSEDPKKRMSDDELLPQLTTLMLGGHETTASTIGWALYELSRHISFQNDVRAEIKATRARAAHKGNNELSCADMDSMDCLSALIKETLRYHPIVAGLFREAARDEVLPLSAPQMTKTGGTITTIPVRKGQRVYMSFAAYNRLRSVWGEDADIWRPQRFLEKNEKTQKISLGVYANVATFSSGLRGCIGWRFALIEMQAILIELIENFEFSPPPGNVEVIRGAAGVMTPMMKGWTVARTELPLTVMPLMCE